MQRLAMKNIQLQTFLRAVAERRLKRLQYSLHDQYREHLSAVCFHRPARNLFVAKRKQRHYQACLIFEVVYFN